MKKLISFAMCIALALMMSACQKDEKAVLKTGTYTLQGAERKVPGDFTITFYDDGTFQYYETPISSYIGMGHYSVMEDVVSLKEDGPGCTGNINNYRIADGKLVFIREESYNYAFVPLEDGAEFGWTADVAEDLGDNEV